MTDYHGTDNLEVMACAINYNAYLTDLVRAQIRSGDRVLDLGAGIGTFARRLASLGYHVDCVEPDRAQGASIAQLGLHNELSVEDYAPASFDFVYTLNVLEHIENDVAALQAIRSRLAPSGRLLIYVPALPFLFSSMDVKVGHERRYTADSLRKAALAAGFSVNFWRYADSLGVPATLVYKWFGSASGQINERALIAYDRLAFPVSLLIDRVVGRWMGKNLWMLAENTGGNG